MLTAQHLIEHHLVAYRRRIAVVDGERRRSYGLLDERSARLANALLDLGASAERPTAILLPNSCEYIETDVACTRAGIHRVGINERLSPSECQYMLEHSGATILVTTPELLGRFDAGAVRGLRGVILVGAARGPGSPPGPMAYEDVLARARARLEVPHLPPDHPAYLIYTSGTTGYPKGAAHTHGSRAASTLNMLASELRVDGHSAMLHVGSLTHGSGSKVIAFLAVGARNVIARRFAPEVFLSAREQGVSHTFLVPTMIQRLLEAGPDVHAAVRALRQISFGGSAISPALFERAIETFGPILTQVYGSAEAPHPVTVLKPEEYASADERERALRSAGRPALSCQVRVVDDDGRDVPPGTVGELLVHGPNVMSGYWKDPTATAAAFTEDRWYRTGDSVSVADDHLVTVIDRKRDLIITGGLNVYPAEVERVLAEHPLVRQCAVVGAPDEEWGEAVVAFVVPAQPGALTEAEVIAWVRTRLAGYKKPRRVEFVDSLPLGSSLKVLRHELRRGLWQGRERRV